VEKYTLVRPISYILIGCVGEERKKMKRKRVKESVRGVRGGKVRKRTRGMDSKKTKHERYRIYTHAHTQTHTYL
jgi:hypothetical protein